MKKYIGTKVVNATPAWRVDGKVYLKDEDQPDAKKSSFEDGYKVIYEGGYESWSPKDVFEKAYREVGSVNFGGAIDLLKAGLAVRRKGYCEFHHIRQLPLVFRCTDVHIGNTGQIRIIENSLMGLSVTAYQTGTVYGKYHRQILNTYIMKDLVICSL